MQDLQDLQGDGGSNAPGLDTAWRRRSVKSRVCAEVAAWISRGFFTIATQWCGNRSRSKYPVKLFPSFPQASAVRRKSVRTLSAQGPVCPGGRAQDAAAAPRLHHPRGPPRSTWCRENDAGSLHPRVPSPPASL